MTHIIYYRQSQKIDTELNQHGTLIVRHGKPRKRKYLKSYIITVLVLFCNRDYGHMLKLEDKTYVHQNIKVRITLIKVRSYLKKTKNT